MALLTYFITDLTKQTLTNEQLASVLQTLEDHIIKESLPLKLYGINALPEKFARLIETIEAYRDLLKAQGVEITIPEFMANFQSN